MDEVRARYLVRIRELLAHFAGNGEVSLEIGALRRAPVAVPAPAGATAAALAQASDNFQGHLDSHYTFDNYVEGRRNQLGRAAAWQEAQTTGDRPHNTLLLYGGTDLGKHQPMFAAGKAKIGGAHVLIP